MRVLHIAETVKGGVSTVINSLIEKNYNYNIESFVLAPGSQIKFIKGGTVVEYNRTGRNVFSFIQLAMKTIKCVKEIQPDIIHLHSSFAGLIVRTLFFLNILSMRKVKVIYTPHAFSFLMDGPKLKKIIYAKIEIFFTKYTDRIVCTSDYEYNLAIKYGIDKSKLLRIYNGVDFSLHSIEPKYILAEKSVKDKINILFVGRFDFQKGYDYLLDIISQLDSDKYSFHIVGDSVVNNKTTKLNKSNVTYYGWVDNNKLNNYFQSADFLIMPSRWESFGIVAIEAQANGLPVLANNNSSLPEVVKDGMTGILQDFNKLDKVIDTIENTSIDTWRIYSRNSFSYVSNKFNVELTKSQYFELYLFESSALIR
ncbi:glycosyltransferase [Klebsiella pneumoniae]|uniref:glycosyltransferase n=1 Tax=Klebsiella pneumoniae complex TaxID=3390273 RepID=UPI00391C7203